MFSSTPILISLTIALILIVPIWYFGFVNRQLTRQTTAAELAGRLVLLSTFSLTSFMLLLVFMKNMLLPQVPNVILILDGLAVAIYVVLQLVASSDAGKESKIRLVQAQQTALEHPDNVRYSWNLAAATLENYLDSNLSQVKWIFNIAVLVMICGFAIIGYGVSLAFRGSLEASVATSVSGLITQFVSVTFMFIYRSTMAQASSNVIMLERLNDLGMAVQLLEKLSTETGEVRDAAANAIINSLISTNRQTIREPNVGGLQQSTKEDGPEVDSAEQS